jgi:DNA gyrase subunit A
MVEKASRGEKESIVVTELPYQVNKARLIEKIAALVRAKKIEGISDLRDESDRDGMRIVMDLKKDAISRVVLNQLYAHTQMQTSFGIIMLALVNKQPRILGLKELLTEFLDFRREVVIRRTRYELRKAEERAHILEGLKKALENIDAVVQLIKKAKNPTVAKEGLQKKFSLTEAQALAILEMRLQRLTGLEREKILDELKELKKKIAGYKAILKSEKLVFKVIREELREIREAYGDSRRTEIIDSEAEVNLEDLIAEEDMVITISHSGYIKRNAVSLYRSQRRGGKGIIAMETKTEDFVEQLFIASTHSYLLFFSSLGRLYWLKVHELPQAGRAAKGKAIVNLLPLRKDEWVSAVMPVREFDERRFVIMATERGVVKKTALSAYSNPRAGGIIALNLDEGDSLISARLIEKDRELFLATAGGKAIRFREGDIRPMGRVARGVTGIKFGTGDRLVGMEVCDNNSAILTVTEKGHGKRTDVEKYRLQKRAGMGTINVRITEKNGRVVGILQVAEDDEVMVVTQEGKAIRMPVKGISKIGRVTQGVRVIDIARGDRVVSIAKLGEKD